MSPLRSPSHIVIPWEANRNPESDRYIEQAEAEVVRSGLLPREPTDGDTARYRFRAFVQICGLVYPYARYERLCAAGGFNQWLFFLDDQYDDDPALGRETYSMQRLVTRNLHVLETGQIIDAADPMERFSASLYGRLRPLCTDRWWRRFVLSVTEYLFSGSLTSMRYWRDGVIPDVDAYMRIRRLDSGMYATLDMVEVAAGIYLPDEVLFHPVVRELRRVTNEHVSFANDLFSYHKEVVRRGYPFNLLHVLMVREGLDVDEAVDRVVGLLNDHSSRFADLVLDLPSWGDELDETMRAYVEGMRCWMVGNYVFSRVSGRYTDPDWVVPELRAPLTLDEVLSPNRSSARGA